MSQFPPRFRAPTAPPSLDAHGRLRTSKDDHFQDHPDDGYGRDSNPNTYGRAPLKSPLGQNSKPNRASYGSQQESPYHRPQAAKSRPEPQKITNLSFWSNDEDDEGEEEWTERQSPTTFILVIVILVVASALLWFLFRWSSSGEASTPPVIIADTTPFKVRPENPGGMMIPHQDKLVYGRFSPNSTQPVERLLPPPEQPMMQSMDESYPDNQLDQGQMGPNQGQQGYPMEGAYAPQQGYAGGPQQPYPQPGPQDPRVQQGHPESGYPPYAAPNHPQPQMAQGNPYPVPNYRDPYAPPQMARPAPPTGYAYPEAQNQGYQPHQGHGPQYNIQPLAQGQQGQSAQGVAPLRKSQGVSVLEPVQPASEPIVAPQIPQPQSEPDDLLELDQLIAQEAEAPLKKKPTVKPGPIDVTKARIQIASLPSKIMAEKEMKRLQSNHGALFGNRSWGIQKVELGQGRGVTYRILVGGFANKAAASQLCSKVKTENIGCIALAPTGD